MPIKKEVAGSFFSEAKYCFSSACVASHGFDLPNNDDNDQYCKDRAEKPIVSGAQYCSEPDAHNDCKPKPDYA
jgi:hypothetical protein